MKIASKDTNVLMFTIALMHHINIMKIKISYFLKEGDEPFIERYFLYNLYIRIKRDPWEKLVKILLKEIIQ